MSSSLPQRTTESLLHSQWYRDKNTYLVTAVHAPSGPVAGSAYLSLRNEATGRTHQITYSGLVKKYRDADNNHSDELIAVVYDN